MLIPGLPRGNLGAKTPWAREEKLTECPALLLPPPYGHGGKAIATVDPRQYALILPTSLVLDLSVLENVIDSLAPAASPPARKGHGACRSPGAHAASLILRHV